MAVSEIELLSIDPDALEAEVAEQSLRCYVRLAWPIVEPGVPFIGNWHIDAICEHLEAVTRGEIRNLLINIPPRCMKSLLVSVFWPTWEWIRAPERRWLTASYAQTLSTRDALKSRRIIESPWYQKNWGERYQLTSDQNQKTRYENNRTGYRIATSVGGTATGEGGDRIIADDPHSVNEALSDIQREAAIIWWDETMSTRLNNPQTGAKIVIMQRLHTKDLAGHILERGGYEHLMLPMAYEPDRKCRTLIFEDPRETPGELLWPERISQSAVDELTGTLGSWATAGQLQQRPAPRGGGLFKRHWFEIVQTVPVAARRVRFWDMAATSEAQGSDPDWTAGALVAFQNGVTYIADMRRGRLSPMGVESLIRQTAEIDGRDVPIYIEQEPGSSGKTVIDHFVRVALQGWDVHGDRPTGSKEARANPLAAQAEAGNVKLVAGAWNAAFLDEAEVFPAGAHDDQIDACSGGYSKLVVSRTMISW